MPFSPCRECSSSVCALGRGPMPFWLRDGAERAGSATCAGHGAERQGGSPTGAVRGVPVCGGVAMTEQWFGPVAIACEGLKENRGREGKVTTDHGRRGGRWDDHCNWSLARTEASEASAAIYRSFSSNHPLTNWQYQGCKPPTTTPLTKETHERRARTERQE
jgi:hypothetical protein